MCDFEVRLATKEIEWTWKEEHDAFFAHYWRQLYHKRVSQHKFAKIIISYIGEPIVVRKSLITVEEYRLLQTSWQHVRKTMRDPKPFDQSIRYLPEELLLLFHRPQPTWPCWKDDCTCDYQHPQGSHAMFPIMQQWLPLGDKTIQCVAEFLFDLGPLWPKMYEYQKEFVSFFLRNNGRAILADDMGLGKTIQCLAAIQCYKSEWPLLIVCPKSVMHTHLRECSGAGIDRVQIVDSTSAIKKIKPKQQVFITSYGIASSQGAREFWLSKKFRCVILDESHYVKTGDSKRTLSLVEITRWCRRIILSSGTLMNRPIDLFSEIRFIDPLLFGDLYYKSADHFTKSKQRKFDYRERYCGLFCQPIRNKYVLNARGSTRRDELSSIGSTLLWMRRNKVILGDALPPKTRERIVLPTPPEHQQLAAMAEARNKYGEKDIKKLEQAFMELYHMLPEVKWPMTSAYLDEFLSNPAFSDTESDLKVLIFAESQFTFHSCAGKLVALGMELDREFIAIEGATSTNHRRESEQRFQTEKNCRFAVLSMRAAGCGLNLQKASIAIFADLYFGPDILIQAEDRIHRLGQTKPVLIRYLVADKTVDESLWRMVNSKTMHASHILEGSSRSFSALDFDYQIADAPM